MKLSLGLVVVAFAMLGCGKKSAASDLALASSASPAGVTGHPGFVVVIPNEKPTEFLVVRIDEQKIEPLERVDVARARKRKDDPVRVVLMAGSRSFEAVSGRVWYNRGSGMVSVWVEDALFVDAHGHEIVVPRRDAQNVVVAPPT